MDPAVAIVRAYLHVNGYFTVTEFPVLEAARGGSFRTVTDLDLLAVRFPGAGRLVAGPGGLRVGSSPDLHLGTPADGIDMLVGEVKEGRAELNRGATDDDVLRAALVRFGCCAPDRVEGALAGLRQRRSAALGDGHTVRLVAFGSMPPAEPGSHRVVLLHHVVGFLRAYLRAHWNVLRHAESKDPALGVLMALEKAERALP
ncbi:MAG TPA: hypothetical protein VM778_07095 [Gemmatimonadota bacterium]|nr:hypothetical protein [Gemmatimonadota bacterium]